MGRCRSGYLSGLPIDYPIIQPIVDSMTHLRLIDAPSGKRLDTGVDCEVGLTRLLAPMEQRRETSHSASHATAPETPNLTAQTKAWPMRREVHAT